MSLRRLWQWLTDRWDPDRDDDVIQLRAQSAEVRDRIRQIREEPPYPLHGNDWLEIADTGRLTGDERGRR